MYKHIYRETPLIPSINYTSVHFNIFLIRGKRHSFEPVKSLTKTTKHVIT